MLCQRSLGIQCKYDTTESSGSISMTTQSVIWMRLVMKRKLPVVSLYYAPYNLSRNHTFKPPNTCERVSVWNIFIIRNTSIDIFSPRWWWWWWWIWWWWWRRRRQWSCWRLFALTMKTAVVVIICFDNGVCDFNANTNQRNQPVLIAQMIKHLQSKITSNHLMRKSHHLCVDILVAFRDRPT